MSTVDLFACVEILSTSFSIKWATGPNSVQYSTFSRIRKVGNNATNANFVLPHSCSFLHNLHLKMLVNVKSDVSR